VIDHHRYSLHLFSLLMYSMFDDSVINLFELELVSLYTPCHLVSLIPKLCTSIIQPRKVFILIMILSFPSIYQCAFVSLLVIYTAKIMYFSTVKKD
jgi:hypothetical protein